MDISIALAQCQIQKGGDPMKNAIFIGIMALAIAILFGCNSESGGSKDQAHDSMQSGDSAAADTKTNSSEDWIRKQPVDVKALDLNGDGYVYQDPMDWDVISDEEGKCPKCGMLLVKVTIADAIQNLEDNGYRVK